MVSVWGRRDSSPVQRVLWTCRELNVPFVRYDVGGKHGGNTTDDYLRMNPNGRVPVVELEGQYLWESNTIVRCLAAKFGKGTLWIDDPIERAHAEKWMDWSITAARNALVPAYMGLIRGGDPSLIEKSKADSVATWEIPEQVLASSPYLAGDRFSVADISAGVLVYRHIGLGLAVGPGVRAWYDRLSQRPAYQEIVAIPLT